MPNPLSSSEQPISPTKPYVSHEQLEAVSRDSTHFKFRSEPPVDLHPDPDIDDCDLQIIYGLELVANPNPYTCEYSLGSLHSGLT